MNNQIDIYITFNELSQSNSFGTYDIDKTVFQQIKTKLGKSTNEYIKNMYYKRNLIIEEMNNNYNTYQKDQYNFIISKSSITIISYIKKLNIDDVPILSQYDNHEKINVTEFINNNYKILLEECNNKYYIHVILLSEQNNISQKIKEIEKLFI